MCPVVLANTTVIFAICCIAWEVEFVFDAPMAAIKSKQSMFTGLFYRKAGDSTDDFLCFYAIFDAGSLYFENL